jgi:hypothetical protein
MEIVENSHLRDELHSSVFAQRIPLAFVFTQGRQFDFRVASISAMNRFAVMAKSLLREPFWITGALRPFRPSVSVAVQGDAFDAKSFAALFELCCPVGSSDAPQIRKERALRAANRR